MGKFFTVFAVIKKLLDLFKELRAYFKKIRDEERKKDLANAIVKAEEKKDTKDLQKEVGKLLK